MEKFRASTLDRLDIATAAPVDEPATSVVILKVTAGGEQQNFAITLKEFLRIADDLAARAAALRGAAWAKN